MGGSTKRLVNRMPKKGKRYGAARAAVPTGVRMAPGDAVKLVRELATAKFDESVDVATRLGVDPRKADQLVRGTVVLPHGTGKSVRVLAIVQGEKEAEATEAGADYVGVEYVEKIRPVFSRAVIESQRVVIVPGTGVIHGGRHTVPLAHFLSRIDETGSVDTVGESTPISR